MSYAPPLPREPEGDPKVDYEVERWIWRRSLSDENVRAMAADYLRGMIDECNSDAFQEYELRWGPHSKHNSPDGPKRRKKRRDRRLR